MLEKLKGAPNWLKISHRNSHRVCPWQLTWCDVDTGAAWKLSKILLSLSGGRININSRIWKLKGAALLLITFHLPMQEFYIASTTIVAKCLYYCIFHPNTVYKPIYKLHTRIATTTEMQPLLGWNVATVYTTHQYNCTHVVRRLASLKILT